MNDFCVYLHKRPDGSPFYVGKGTLYRARKLLRRNNQHHRNIVSKYGKENILIEIVKSNLSESNAFLHEIETITRLKEAGCRLCNRSAGGEGPSNPCKETRRRMSEAQSKRTYSAAVRENMRRGQIGRKHSEEVKAKIGAGNRGKVLSELTKEKLCAANLGKPQSQASKEKNRQAQMGNQRALCNKFSEELKFYLSSIRKGRLWTEKRKKASELLRWQKYGNSQYADIPGDIQNAII